MSNDIIVTCFQDTLILCENDDLRELTSQGEISTKVYKENFKSKYTDADCIKAFADEKSESELVAVKEGTTFATAKEYVGKGKIGVLNFANPYNPGGGVLNGAMAQEECLCRSSNLYPCLWTDAVQREYYTYNKETTDFFFSDRIVYSDKVTVFKTDDIVPELMPKADWFSVSVITCAAPYLENQDYVNWDLLKVIFKKRIENIFEVAIENDIKVLVLGAFGCGAFKNPPDIVARAFHEVIKENFNKFKCRFEKIIFAIKSPINNNFCDESSNINVFRREFNVPFTEKDQQIRLENNDAMKALGDEKLQDILNEKDIIGKVVGGKYELLKLIGKGGISAVYLAVDIFSGDCFAVKEIVRTSNDKNRDYIVNAILSEVNMLESFDHPALTKVIDVIYDGANVYVVMEYVEGETLERIVSRQGVQAVDTVIDWAKQLCEVLYYLHTLTPPHIYRDVKPANIILNSSGKIKIIDVGIMRTYKEGKSADTVALGTRGYAAPEQYGSRQSDCRTDIYALGVTIYQLLTGLDPKENDFVLKPLCQVNPSFPKGLEYIVKKCVELDPGNRYQNCMDLYKDLDNYNNLPPKESLFKKLFNKK